jgi:hypothetical protein
MNKRFLSKVASLALIGAVIPISSFAAETDTYNSKNEYTITYNNVRSGVSSDQIINFAKQQLGKPYVWGQSGPNSFDCSGFIHYVYSNNGYNIPRTTVEGYWNSSSIKKVSTPKKGDLIFFKGTYGGPNHPSHIGIMINENEFINASSGGKKIQIDNKNSSYWTSKILGYGNIIPESANKQPVYRIETGGFKLERAKYEVEFLKGHFGWDGSIKPNKADNKYRIETGGFTLERAKYEVEFLKGHFGWDGFIEPNGNIPNEYKIVIFGFTGQDNVKDAQSRLESATGWWTTIGEDDSNEYKIVIDGFTGEDNVKDAQRRLESATGWWTTYIFTGEYK